MPLTGAQRQRRYTERVRGKGEYDAFKAKHAEQQKNRRIAEKNKVKLLSPSVQKNIDRKRREAVKKRVAEHRQRKREAAKQADLHEPFCSAISFAKATARAKRMMSTALPSSPRRRDAVCRKLYATHTGKVASTSECTPKRSSALSVEVTTKIVEYYQRDDVSRQAPGRKDATTVRKDDGTKTKIQTRHLTSSVMEIYAMFSDDEPNVKVGKSKFAELRPKHVQLSNKLPHNVCLCKYHENFIAAINNLHGAIPGFPPYSQALPVTFLCQSVTSDCWMNQCDACSDGQAFISTYGDVLQEESVATWYVWKNDADNRLCRVLEDGTTNDLQLYIQSLLPQFLQHCHTKREQAAAYQSEREAAASEGKDTSHALIQVDFAENYTCVAQDEIQSAHWKQHQVSLFTAAVWHSGDIHSYVIASDNIVHSKETVIAYVDRLLDVLPSNIKSTSFWSDGPSSQFKNRFHIASIIRLQNHHDIEITWNYFATSHGKGPVDGIGGSVKRHVWSQVSSRKQQVDSACTFVLAAQDMQRVKVFEMTSGEIDDRNRKMALQQVFEEAPVIPNVSKVHCVIVTHQTPITMLLTKQRSVEVGAVDTDEVHTKVGDWIVVEYDHVAYPGEVVAVVSGDYNYKVSVMVPAGKNWKWPTPRDTVFYARHQIIRKLKRPIPINSRGHFEFDDYCVD